MRNSLRFFVLIVTPVLLGTLILTGAGAARESSAARPAVPAPQWGPDIPVSPTERPTYAADRNAMLAIRPGSPNVLIAGWDSLEDSQLASGYGSSHDGGLSWNTGRFVGPWGQDALVPSGNVSVAFDGHGTGYYAGQAANNTLSGYYVLTTTDGLTWSTPLPIAIYDYSQARSAATLVADPRTSGPYAGSLYMFWYGTQNSPPYYLGILMRYSRNGGRTWSDEILVSDPGHETSYRPYPLVAADGTVYVAFEELDNFYSANPPKLYVDRSTNGGKTWGVDHLISGAPIIAIGRPDYKGRELTLVADPNCVLLRINHFPVIGVAPDNPQIVYAAWNDGRWGVTTNQCGSPTQESDIAFSRSTDAGATWTAPVRINDDEPGNGIDHFEPKLAVHADGTVGLVWYDRRSDPNDYLYDLYYSQSPDGGGTWSPNQRVTDMSSNAAMVVDIKGIADIGYRPALVYGPDYALAGWLDTRNGDHRGDLYVDHGVIDLPSPTPTVPGPTATPSAIPPSATPPPGPSSTPTTPPTSTLTSTATAQPSMTPTLQPALTPSATPCALTFSDVPPAAYFAPAVGWLACRAILSGYADGTFRPANPTTRGQLVKLVVNGFGWPLTTPATPTFADVPPAQPFAPFIETALAHGVIDGYSCGGAGEPCPGRYFRPGAAVTRGQLAKIVVNARGWAPLFPPAATFADVPAGDAFFGFVERAAAQNVLSGYSCGGAGEPCPGRYFRPAAASTRGQLAKILYNVLTQP